jgi:phosphatidylglycerophosphatase A
MIFLNKISLVLATCFGLGYLIPIGQGTLGAFFALFFIPVFIQISLSGKIILILSAVFLGIFIAGLAEKVLRTKDDHRIIIDEFISIFITFVCVGSKVTFFVLIVGFFLNRIFDWIKPYPAGKLQNLRGGWGIIADDIVSGAMAGLVLLVFGFFS